VALDLGALVAGTKYRANSRTGSRLAEGGDGSRGPHHPLHRRAAHAGGRGRGRRRRGCQQHVKPALAAANSAAWVPPPSTSTGNASRRTQRWSGGFSHRGPTASVEDTISILRACASAMRSITACVSDAALVAAAHCPIATLRTGSCRQGHRLVDEAASMLRMEIDSLPSSWTRSSEARQFAIEAKP